MAIEKWTQFHCAAIKRLCNLMEWIPHSLRLNGKKIPTPSGGEETDGVNLSHDGVVELPERMLIAIIVIELHGSGTG